MVGRKCKKRGLQKLRACLPAVYEVESLERRTLLSVNALTLAGPFFTTGAVFVYTETSDQVAGSATATQTVIGPTTAPTGQPAMDRESVTEATSDKGVTSTETSDSFYAITPTGVVQYGKEDTSTDGSVDEISYLPPQQTALKTLIGGVEESSSTTETDVNDFNGSESTSTAMITDNYVLVSETPQMMTVPAGTFSAYHVMLTETHTASDGTVSGGFPQDEYWSPKAGLIELVTHEGGQAGDLTAVLTSYSVPADHLVFTTQPPTGAQLNTAIPMTVTVEDSTNSVDTTATGTIDLTLNTVANGVGAVLGGTISVSLVNGVATFTTSAGPTIDVAGTYTITATDNGAVATTADATSTEFGVGNSLTWTGAGNATSWSDAKNWDLNEAPISGDSLIFPGGAPASPNNDIAGLTINTIDIQGGGYTLTGNAISLTGGLTSEAGNNTYNIDTTLVGSPTIDDVTGDLTIASVLSGDSLTISGNGIDTFDQADTYTGTTTLSAGVTIDDSVLDGAFGNGEVIIGAGSDPVSIDDTGAGPAMLDNDITFQDGSTLAVDPQVILGGTVTVNGKDYVEPMKAGDQLTINSGNPIAGSGTLTILGGGKVLLQDSLPASIQIIVAQGELDLDGTLDGAITDTSQVSVRGGGTVILMSKLSGNGGIDVAGTLKSADDVRDYVGTITIDPANIIDQKAQLLVSADNALGTGKLVVGPTEVLGVSAAPIIDATAAGHLVTLNNQVILHDGSDLAVSGAVTLGGSVFIDGSPNLFTAQTNDDLTIPYGIQGSGTLMLGGFGTLEIDGSIPASVVLDASYSASKDLASSMHFNLGATLLGAAGGTSQVVSDCNLQILPSLGGSGGIDLQGGMLTSAGALGYMGTVTIESYYFGLGAANFPDVILTGASFPLGIGPLVVQASEVGTLNSYPGEPILDASQIPQGVILNNALMLQNFGSLQIAGTVSFADTVNVSGQVGLVPGINNSALFIKNGIAGSGTLNLDLGSASVAGTIAAGTFLVDGTSFTGIGLAELSLSANLAGAQGGTPQVTVANNGTITLKAGFTGTGGIDVKRGTLQSNISPTYTGDINLDGGLISLGAAANPLGTGQIIATGGGIDATAAPNGVTLSNALTMKTDQSFVSFSVTGTATFTAAVTISDAKVYFDVDGTSDLANLTGGIQGTGTVTFNEYGTVNIFGDVAAGISLVADEPPNIPAPISNTLGLGANLMGAAGSTQVTVLNSTLHLLKNLDGSGGIDMQSGTLQSDGVPSYSGTIILEQRYPNPLLASNGPTTLPDPDVVLTSASFALGSGPISLAKPTANASMSFSPPTIDASGVAGGVILNNALNVQPNTVLDISGSVNFSGTTTVVLGTGFATTNATDQLTFSGTVQGLGSIVVDGPGTTTVTGNLAQGLALFTAGSMTGTLEIATALSGVDGGPNQVNLSAGIVSLLGNVTGNGGIGVTGGTLISAGVPGYVGPITVGAGGTVKDYDSADAFGLGTGILTLAGGLLQNSSGGTAILSNPVTVSGAAQISSRGARFKLADPLNMAAGGSLDVVGTLALTGSITGSGSITLDSDLFAVAGTSPSFSGAIKWNSGIVQVAPLDDPLGTGLMTSLASQGVLQSATSIDPVIENPLVVQSGTLTLEGQFTFPSGITVDPGATLIISGTGSAVVDSGTLSGGGNIIVAAGNFSDPGGSSGFTGTVQIQSGAQITPNITVADASGAYTGLPYTATATLSAPGISPSPSLQGISPTFTYYSGSTVTGVGTSTAPTGPGTFTVVASFAGSAAYSAAESAPVTFTITPATATIFAAGNSITIPEGESFTGALASFTDSDANLKASDFTATINLPRKGKSVSRSLQIESDGHGGWTADIKKALANLEEGTFQYSIAITDDAGATPVTVTATVKVVDRIKAKGKTISAAAGVMFDDIVATFSTDDRKLKADAYSALIDWGDGQTTQGVIKKLGDGTFVVIGKHEYSTSGTYHPTITITNTVLGGSAMATAKVVAAAPPTHKPGCKDDPRSDSNGKSQLID